MDSNTFEITNLRLFYFTYSFLFMIFIRNYSSYSLASIISDEEYEYISNQTYKKSHPSHLKPLLKLLMIHSLYTLRSYKQIALS